MNPERKNTKNLTRNRDGLEEMERFRDEVFRVTLMSEKREFAYYFSCPTLSLRIEHSSFGPLS